MSDFGGDGHRNEIDYCLRLTKLEHSKWPEHADWCASWLAEEVERMRALFLKLGLSDYDGRKLPPLEGETFAD